MQTNLQQFSRGNMFHVAVGSFAVARPSLQTMPQWRLAPISVDYCTLLRLARLAFNWNMILRLTMIESVDAEQMSGASKIRFSISAICRVPVRNMSRCRCQQPQPAEGSGSTHLAGSTLFIRHARHIELKQKLSCFMVEFLKPNRKVTNFSGITQHAICKACQGVEICKF